MSLHRPVWCSKWGDRFDGVLERADVPVDEIESPENVEPEAAIDARRLGAAVAAAVRALRPRDRRVVELHYFEGHSFTEMSRRLGLTREYIARVHFRALRDLEAALADTVRLHDCEARP